MPLGPPPPCAPPQRDLAPPPLSPRTGRALPPPPPPSRPRTPSPAARPLHEGATRRSDSATRGGAAAPGKPTRAPARGSGAEPAAGVGRRGREGSGPRYPAPPPLHLIPARRRRELERGPASAGPPPPLGRRRDAGHPHRRRLRPQAPPALGCCGGGSASPPHRRRSRGGGRRRLLPARTMAAASAEGRGAAAPRRSPASRNLRARWPPPHLARGAPAAGAARAARPRGRWGCSRALRPRPHPAEGPEHPRPPAALRQQGRRAAHGGRGGARCPPKSSVAVRGAPRVRGRPRDGGWAAAGLRGPGSPGASAAGAGSVPPAGPEPCRTPHPALSRLVSILAARCPGVRGPDVRLGCVECC
ncbi:basic proline-rich protein-like [Falco rusticolus]|uniref:basic proline-rich protein-like n=1 Tax=Falco rusticolus TaxID=120794 RepID=UPI0018869BEA|nr:basic proline-rich protein-like [Falco rusticolus]